MRDRLLSSPPWAQAVLGGLVLGLGNAATGLWVGNRTAGEAAVTGAVVGFAFALVGWPILARQQRQAMDAVLTRSPALLRRATRAATRGPVPEDPDLRAAARRYALHQRAELLRSRRWGLPSFGVLCLVVLAAGLECWPLAVALVLVGLHTHVVVPRRLARRADLLADVAAEAGSAGKLRAEPPLRPPPPA